MDLPGADPIGFVQGTVADYVLQNTATTDLGGGIIERTLNFDSITGPVQLEETPLDGTLVVFDGLMPVAAGQYSVVSNKIHLHRGADGDHNPLPDVRLCARRTARPQGLRERIVQIPAPIKLRHLDQVSLSTACLLPPCLSKRSQ